MFWNIVSAMGRDMCALHPEPTIMMVSIWTSAIIAAPCAIFFAASYIASVRG